MRIGVLTQYFEPEIGAAPLRYRAVVRELTDLGHEVVVLTALPNHPTGAIFPGYRGRLAMTEQRDGATVHRVWVYPAIGRGAKRYVNFLSFVVGALLFSPRLARCDVVVVESPPVTVAVPALALRWLARRRLVTYVSDLSINSIEQLGVGGAGVLMRLLGRIERLLYRSSDVVTVVTDGQARVLETEIGIDPERIVMLENGADTELFSPRPPDPQLAERFGVAGRTYVLYAGTHGYAHGLDTALDAAAQLRSDGITFLFVGEGSDKDRVVAEAARRGLDNCRFFPQQPPEVIAGLYAGAVAGLSTIRDIQVMHDARPAKLFACLSCARPVVYAGFGEGAAIVTAADAGIVCDPGDGAAVAAGITWLVEHPAEAAAMGDRGRRYIVDHFSWGARVRAWSATLADRRTLRGHEVS